MKAPPVVCRYPNVISQCKPEIAKPGLDFAVRPVALFLICNSLVELLCLRARFVQHGSPVASVFGRITARRGRKPSRSDIEQQPANGPQEIGRASCRERVCQYVEISVVAGSLTQKKLTNITIIKS